METVGSGLLVFETVKGVSSFSPELCFGFGLVSDGEYALNFSNFHPRPGRGQSRRIFHFPFSIYHLSFLNARRGT